MSDAPNDYFNFHYNILKWYILLPFDNPVLKALYNIIIVPHVILITSCVIFESGGLLVATGSDFSSTVLIIAVLMLHLQTSQR